MPPLKLFRLVGRHLNYCAWTLISEHVTLVEARDARDKLPPAPKGLFETFPKGYWTYIDIQVELEAVDALVRTLLVHAESNAHAEAAVEEIL